MHELTRTLRAVGHFSRLPSDDCALHVEHEYEDRPGRGLVAAHQSLRSRFSRFRS